MRRRCSRFLLFSLLLVFTAPGTSSPPVFLPPEQPIISIIIDDLGDHLERDFSVVELPGPVTLSLLPHTPHARSIAHYAADMGKEVMLHLPMEPMGTENMGPGGLTEQMDRADFTETLLSDIDHLPNIVGINNHMGSKLTRSTKQMRWLMETLEERHPSLFFVDSFTSLHSVAFAVATEYSVPRARRDVFLDHDRDLFSISLQFKRLIAKAKKHGSALAIAHPYPETIEFLSYWLPRLEQKGVKLVPASEFVELRQRREPVWRASLSPLRRVAKN